MVKKRHAPRDREKRFGDTAERSHCDACRKHNQDIHAGREDGEAAHAEVTSVNILLHWVQVRDYKKRRRDRNSNMQPLTCSSSDTAMETVTNPQKDTSYSRRQRPHEGEIP